MGHPWARGFPSWITLPGEQSLAEGRLWHFFFAWLFVLNGALYLVAGCAGGHFRRDLLPSGHDLATDRADGMGSSAVPLPQGRGSRHYNVLQKLAYLVVIVVFLPVIVLAGLTMSPRMDAAFPQLLTIFDGRQSARTIHFILAWALVAFVLIHVFMVLVSGVWNNLRSMLTGRYAIEDEQRCRGVTGCGSIAGSWSPARRGALGTMLLGGCEPLSEDPTVQRVLASAERLTGRPAPDRRRASAGPRIHRGRPVAAVQEQRHVRSGRRRLSGTRGRRSSPTGGCR